MKKKCKACKGHGETVTCDTCKKDCTGDYYECAECEKDLCDKCAVQNDFSQVVCPKHNKSVKVRKGGCYKCYKCGCESQMPLTGHRC